MIGQNSSDLFRYAGILKGNYKKGISNFRNILSNKETAEEFCSAVGVNVLFGLKTKSGAYVHDRNSAELLALLNECGYYEMALRTFLSEKLGLEGTIDEIINNETAMAAVLASETAMAAVLASETAMAAVLASETAMATILASETAMAAVTESPVAVAAFVAIGDVALTDTIMAAVLASETAMAAVAASPTAMAVVAASPIAINRIAKSAIAKDKLIARNDVLQGQRLAIYETVKNNPTYFTLSRAKKVDYATSASDVYGVFAIVFAIPGSYDKLNPSHFATMFHGHSKTQAIKRSGDYTDEKFIYVGLGGATFAQQVDSKVTTWVYTAI